MEKNSKIHKFSVSLNDEVYNDVMLIANAKGYSRAGLINAAVRDYVEKEKALSLFGDLKVAIEKISKNENLNDDDKVLIRDFNTCAEMMMKYTVTK